jgi:arylsulfatase A-like enzyme
MDALCNSGIRFQNAYCYPVFSPSRATLVTGRYSRHNGVHWLLKPTTSNHLPFAETTLAELMQQDAPLYTVSFLGKWHLGITTDPFVDPALHGWNRFAGTEVGFTDYFNWEKWYLQPGVGVWSQQMTTYAVTDLTDDAILAANTLPEPWMLIVAYRAVHGPRHDPPPHLRTRPLPLDTQGKQLWAMTEAFDTELGRLMAQIDLVDTTVIFAGDNGTKGGLISSSPDNASKKSLHDGGVNIPFAIAGAGVASGLVGTTSTALVNFCDVFETVAEIVGAAGPGDAAAAGRDSVSLVPIMMDATDIVRDFAYTERLEPQEGPPFTEVNKRMIRDERFRYVRNVLDRTRDRFYDLEADLPGGHDGINLCPCPDNLSAEKLAAFNKLQAAMDAIGPDLP